MERRERGAGGGGRAPELVSVLRNFLDSLVEDLELFLSGLILGTLDGTLGNQSPCPAQETVHTINALGIPGLDLPQQKYK
jgi:hypothetical protein